MREMKKLLLALVLLWPVGAVAETSASRPFTVYESYKTGEELQDWCAVEAGEQKSQPTWGAVAGAKRAACLSYLVGLHDAQLTFYLFGGLPKPIFCSPNGITADQLRLAWLKYVALSPGMGGSSSASDLAILAFTARWPCESD